MTEDEFIERYQSLGATNMARTLGMDVASIQKRRQRIERKRDMQILPPDRHRSAQSRVQFNRDLPGRITIKVDNGYVMIGSDAHYWPGLVSPAHRAFVKLAKKLKPEAVIMNGDMLDGAGISRHPPIGWEEAPTLIDEIDTNKERLAEIEKAAPEAFKAWPLGNHDARFETNLAAKAPEYAKIHGVHLQDHFPEWAPCWSVWINDEVVVKHRYKGGIHATHNNTVASGKTMITGHLHSARVTPYTDYNGTRYGVDLGTMADPNGPQFNYTEDNPRNHRQGFAILKFSNGRLMYPQLVTVIDENTVEYLNKEIKV
jgi:hypothetical protein